MNAQPVMTAKAAGRATRAPQRATPAASLAGMRLWKEPAQAAGADQRKPGVLLQLPQAEGPGTVTAAAAADAGPPPVPDWVDPPTAEPPLSADAEDGVEAGAAVGSLPALAIAEGGLEPHVSPYPQRARTPERRDSDILGYWARIRGERDMPAWRDLDQNQIAYFWPNSFLLECKARGHGSRPIILKATRVVDHDGVADRSADIAFTPPMVSWILGVGVDVVEVESPLDGQHSFRREDGERDSYDIIAMPLGADDHHIDHVLCHVKRR